MTLVDVFVDIFYALDAASKLYVAMALEFSEKICVVGYHPLRRDVSECLLVSSKLLNDWPMKWSFVHWIAIRIDNCMITVWERKAFRTFTRVFRMIHAWAVGVKVATRSMDHVLCH